MTIDTFPSSSDNNNNTTESYTARKREEQLQGVIYNSYNKRYVKGWTFSSSFSSTLGRDTANVMIHFCSYPDLAQLIKKVEFESSFFFRNPNYHFRTHDPSSSTSLSTSLSNREEEEALYRREIEQKYPTEVTNKRRYAKS